MNPTRHFLALALVVLCCGFADGCKTPPVKPDADPTTKGAKSPVPDAIAKTGTNAAAALAASEAKAAATEKQASKAAASVAAIRTSNTNQPPGPATEYVDKEAGVALGSLPAPDPTAALEAERRRAAVFAGQAEEARKLYAAATSAADAAKAEVARLGAAASDAKAKAEAAQAALVAADAKWAATLKANEAANQAKLDDAEKRADEAEEKAKNERHKLIFRCLLGLGLLCIAGAIAMAVMTSGAMLAKSLMLAGAGALCVGLAQVISHPWFDRIAGAALLLAVIGGVFYLWKERQDALTNEAYQRTVEALDTVGAINDAEGKPTRLAGELGRVLDAPHKKIVKAIKRATVIKKATA